MGYVEEHGVTVTAELLIEYDNAVRDHYPESDPERIRLGLEAMSRALERHRTRLTGQRS